MESEPTPTTTDRRPSGSSARRGSASAASRARSGAKRVDPERPDEVTVQDSPAAMSSADEARPVGEEGAEAEAAAAPAKPAPKPRRAPAAKAPAAKRPAARTPAAKAPTDATTTADKAPTDADPAAKAPAAKRPAARKPAAKKPARKPAASQPVVEPAEPGPAGDTAATDKQAAVKAAPTSGESMRLAPELQFARGDLLDAKVAAPAKAEPDELDDEADDVEAGTDTAEPVLVLDDEPTAEAGTAPVDEPTAETASERADEPTAEAGTAPADEPAAETASEPADEPTAELEPDEDEAAEPDEDAVPEPELAEASEPEADDEADAEPEQTSESDPEPEPDGEPESKADGKAESKAEPEADSEPEPETEATEPEPEPETEATAPARRGPASVFRSKRTPVRAIAPESPAAEPAAVEVALSIEGLSKYFGGTVAVDSIDLEVAPGAFFGIVGPNGAGKTTTLSMITGLLRPDSGVVRVFGADVWRNAQLAKRKIGVLPDRLRLFDRLTGSEFLFHAGALRGLDRATISQRSADLSAAFGLEHSLHRLVSDYSVGMTKKIAIAAAMIHAPRLLVLDEPFESVDPVSVAVVIGVLKRFTAAGGTVILSSHSMELTERVCDGVAIIADGAVLAAGPLDEVLQGQSLEERFVELAGGEAAVEDMEWLQNFSD